MKRLNKLPGDSVSYIRRAEMRAMFWHDGCLYEYKTDPPRLEYVRDLHEAELSQDEQDALNKRRRYFGIPAS